MHARRLQNDIASGNIPGADRLTVHDDDVNGPAHVVVRNAP